MVKFHVRVLTLLVLVEQDSNMPVNGTVAVSLCALGVVGSLFIGYCIYFDRKRRSHPDYKKKVRERKLRTRVVSM